MKKIFLMLLAAVSLVACDKGGEDTPPKTITIPNQQQLTQTVYADDNAGKSDVTFKTTGAWTSEIAKSTTAKSPRAATDWVSISPSSGDKAGEYTISISLETNHTGERRVATITIICGGEKITITITQEGTTESGDKPADEQKYDIYIAGSENNAGKYWKNGEVFSVSGGIVDDISVLGSDIYHVAGNNLYKNNILQNLPSKENVNCLILSGSDVYAGGNTVSVSELNSAAYWKNGALTKLPTAVMSKGGYGVAAAIYMSGSDVFTCGNEYNGNGSSAVYWKNTAKTMLAYYPNSYTSISGTYATDILVAQSGTVHVVGWQRAQDANTYKVVNSAIYWVNGVASLLSESRVHPNDLEAASEANAVTVVGSDVYVAGSIGISNNRSVAVYWKNKEAVHLTNGERVAGAYDIVVVDGDVYVAGYENDESGKHVAKYWKNGKSFSIGGSNSEARKIVLTTKKI